MCRALIILFCACSCFAVRSQTARYRLVDDLTLAYAGNKIKRLDSLVTFVKTHFQKNDERVRAFYTWIASQVAYDTDLLDQYRLSAGFGLQNLSSQRTQHPDTVFKYRKAVCEGICQLMNECCKRVGINSRMVGGITRLDNVVDEKLLHTWNVIWVDTSWRLVDITWSGGHINHKGQYVKDFNDRYFFTRPSEFIKDHWPLDPMWQLLEHPVTKQDFFSGNPVTASLAFFAFNDSIRSYLKLNKDEQAYTDLIHQHRADPQNENYTLTADYLIYNKAVAIFNRASLYFEDYVEYAKKLEGKPVTKKHTSRCIQLLQQPKKHLEEGLTFARDKRFFHAEVKHKFNEMVASSFQRYRDVNDLITRYEKLLKNLN